MSRISSYRTTIAIPRTQQANIKGSSCFDILQKALEKVAQDRGGRLTYSYLDSDGREHECLIGVKTRDFPRGIGINIAADGKIVFSYDAYDKVEVAKAICDEITQNYVVIAVMRAQQRHGFRLQEPQFLQKPGGIKHVKVVGLM